MYESYLKDWFKVFPREQILILRLEDYSEDINNVLNKVYDYLGLRKYDIIIFFLVNYMVLVYK